MGLAYAEKNGGRFRSQVLRDPLRIRGSAAQSTQNYLKTRPDPALVLEPRQLSSHNPARSDNLKHRSAGPLPNLRPLGAVFS